ncbi:MAG: Tetrahydromethanopterin S-methyltransferase subunit A 1 [Candidatus Methanocomedens sp.]|nr:MAG: Tetrahydromethanopterin S-methyltransferase subunit A 1 [ANME-2 cluster archaeon]
MADKREPSVGWPVMKGEYEIADPNNPVAVATLGSHLEAGPHLEAGASITGPCKTENIGIEKLVANIISNPNIRFLLITGSEVKGHLTGDAILKIHANGTKENRIVGATGAIPYIENLTEEAIARFQEQVECIDLINTEDQGKISGKIKELAGKDPGAFDAEPMVIELKDEGEGEDEFEGIRPMAAEVALIQSRIRNVEVATIDIGNLNKFASGVYSGKIEGVMMGLTLTLGLLGLLIMGGV